MTNNQLELRGIAGSNSIKWIKYCTFKTELLATPIASSSPPFELILFHPKYISYIEELSERIFLMLEADISVILLWRRFSMNK
jgi:hypothetical protein